MIEYKNCRYSTNLIRFELRYGLKNYEINDIILLELTLAEGVYDISRNGNKRIKKSIK